MKYFYDTFTTPLGDFSVATDEAGSIVATAFGGLASLKKRFPNTPLARDPSKANAAREQVEAYFAGKRREFSLKLAPHGTAFQERVWNALKRIPYGRTCSYGEMAASLGNAKASRAVGRANATNPICLIVPCHRVIGANGSLTGFAFGEEIKRRLLEHEGVAVEKLPVPAAGRS